MKLQNISIHNFLSIGDIELQLSGRGLVLINGINKDTVSGDSNGAGKSAILEAVVWVLYGKTLRDIPADAVVNRFADSGAVVKLDFTVDDLPYQVIRARKHDEYGSGLFLYQGDTNLTLGTVKQTQEKLESILGMDFTTFTSSIVFGQGYASVFTTMKDADRKEVLEKILELNVFSKCLEEVKLDYRELEADTANLNSTLTTLYTTRDSLVQSIKSLKDKLTQRKKEIKEEIKELNDAIKANAQEGTQLKAKREALLVKLASIDDNLKEYREVIQPYIKEVEQLLNKSRGAYLSLDKQRELMEKKVKELQDRVDNITAEFLNKPCDRCGRVITEAELPHVLASVLQELEINGQATKALIDQVKALKEEYQKYEKEYNSKLLEKDEKFDEFIKQRDILQRELNDVTAKLSRIVESLKRMKENKAEKESSTELETITNLITEKQEELKQVIDAIKAHQEKLESFKSRKDVLSFWKNGFGNGGIKSWVINSYLDFINQRIQYYIQQLGYTDLIVQFVPVVATRGDNEVDRVELQVVNGSGGESYLANSGGERRRIDVAVLCALQDLVRSRRGKSANVLFLDEIFDTLDGAGIEAVVYLLGNFIHNNDDSIFVISHNSELKPYFDRVITVVKKDKITRLEEEVEYDRNFVS